MIKKLVPLSLATVGLLALGACTKTNEPVNTSSGTTPPSAAGTQAPGTTEKSTDTTRPRSTGTTSRSTGTTMKGSEDFQFTADEEQCVLTAIAQFPDTESALQNGTGLTAEQAGVVGGVVTGCVPKPRLADGLVSGLKDSPKGRSLTQSDLSCLRDQIISLDSADLAVFVGIIVYSGNSDDPSVSAPIISKLNSACNTAIPA